jgi:diguanylate cyclase (GGDEF)-like protein
MLDRQIAATLISLRRAWKAPAGARQPPAPTLDADDAFTHATAAIVITDARLRVVAANPAYAALTGQALSACIGQPLPGVHPDALDGQPREVRCGQGEGVTRTAWMQLSTVTDAQGAVLGHVATLADISALEHERRVLRQLAQHDALTQLPNRRLLAEELERSIARVRRHGQKLALLFMDLDRFKWVNDNLGHEAGDTMLQEVARRLRSTVRAEDLVGRWGGDEFIVVLDAPADAAAALRTAALLQAAIERRVEFAGHGVSLSASIGVAMYPDDADGQAGLIRGADAAMYRAKHEGRGRTVLARPA